LLNIGEFSHRLITLDPRKSGEFTNMVHTNNYAAEVTKVSGRNFLGKGDYFKFPDYKKPGAQFTNL
jgi:hypothetical protein